MLFYVCHYLPKHNSLKYNFVSYGFGPLCLDTCENWFWFWFVWHRSAACAPELIHLTRSRRNSAFSSPLLPDRCLCIFSSLFSFDCTLSKHSNRNFDFTLKLMNFEHSISRESPLVLDYINSSTFSSRNHCSQFFFIQLNVWFIYFAVESITA